MVRGREGDGEAVGGAGEEDARVAAVGGQECGGGGGVPEGGWGGGRDEGYGCGGAAFERGAAGGWSRRLVVGLRWGRGGFGFRRFVGDDVGGIDG